MENEKEIVDSTNNTETTENHEETTEVVEEKQVEQVDDVEALKKENETLKAQKEHWRKKASEAKPEKPVEKNENELSQADMLAVLRAGVDDEYLPTIQKYAKLEGVTVSKALKTEFITSYLDSKKEEKKSAQASNTGKARASTSRVSDDTLLEKARTGKDLSEDEMERLWLVRKGIKTTK